MDANIDLLELRALLQYELSQYLSDDKTRLVMERLLKLYEPLLHDDELLQVALATPQVHNYTLLRELEHDPGIWYRKHDLHGRLSSIVRRNIARSEEKESEVSLDCLQRYKENPFSRLFPALTQEDISRYLHEYPDE